MNRKDYFKKRDNIMDRWNRGEITYDERCSLLRELSHRYKSPWGNTLFENTYNLEEN